MLKVLSAYNWLVQADSPLKATPPETMAGNYGEHLQNPQIPSTGALSLFQSSSIMLAPTDSFESRGMFLKLKAIQSNTSSLLLPDNARRNGET